MRKLKKPLKVWDEMDKKYRLVYFLADDKAAFNKDGSMCLGVVGCGLTPVVVDISYGGCTGINSYHFSDGSYLTCKPSDQNKIANHNFLFV